MSIDNAHDVCSNHKDNTTVADATKTVLLVDDDPDFLLTEKIQLEAAGFSTISAEGAKEARERLETATFDLAVIDVMMEETDAGFTLCHHIKRKHPDVPVILVTSVDSETGMRFDASTEEERSWIKADAFLPKPIRFEQLMKEINRLLDR